ncbi:related to serine protease [Rhynchosporium graminicola]|uniref:Related to serine protease n=1 Tax=Rhynchosporium graminicola TaxID=2792576 RepID=A0A1E1L6G9_9HELO|nr:related to serine protease [Rhynchosporium commune]
MRFSVLVLAIGFAAIAQSVAVPKSHVLHEKRDSTNYHQWVRRGKISPSAILPVRIGLKQQNLENGHDYLLDISHPDSPMYGKHWTSEEVIQKFAPEQKTVDAVTEWLTDSGVDAKRIIHSDNRGWLAFDATTEEAEGLLHTKYHIYEHESEGHMTAACESYHLPKNIQDHIDYITPGVKLFAPKKRYLSSRTINGQPSHSIKIDKNEGFPATAAGELSRCDRWITPGCIRALYSVPSKPEYFNNTPRTDNALGIFESGDAYAQQDINSFFANFTRYIPQGTHPNLASIDGGEAPEQQASAGGGESALDLELAYPLIWPQNITLYQTDDWYWSTFAYVGGGFNTFLDALDGSYCTYSAFGQTGNDPDLDPIYPNTFVKSGYQGQLMCGVYKPANVISVSYGGQEADVPEYYQRRQCDEFMKLGLQGVSLIWSSGDSGVAGPTSRSDPSGCLGSEATVFNPTWPNNCPYITNVGATKVYPGHTVWDPEPESACNDLKDAPYSTAYSSGGGFSNFYPAPDYQKNALQSYFEKHAPAHKSYDGKENFDTGGGIYNRLGRGIPDVSANGDNIPVYSGDDFARAGGTSASAPIFASLINRINEKRLNAGKSVLGFLNPALYANPSMLNDIRNGTNPGCGTEGFSAVEGWDPVTGLGTPNYKKMLEYFMGLS